MLHEPLLAARRPRATSPLALCGAVGLLFVGAVGLAQVYALRSFFSQVEDLKLELAAAHAVTALDQVSSRAPVSMAGC